METGTNVISASSLAQAVADGELVEVFKQRWPELSGGKPIVATRAAMATLSLAAIQEIWNAYVQWRTNVMATLPEADQLFVTQMNGVDVWVLEDGAAFTVVYPDDY